MCFTSHDDETFWYAIGEHIAKVCMFLRRRFSFKSPENILTEGVSTNKWLGNWTSPVSTLTRWGRYKWPHFADDISRVSCQKGPTRHAYAFLAGYSRFTTLRRVFLMRVVGEFWFKFNWLWRMILMLLLRKCSIGADKDLVSNRRQTIQNRWWPSSTTHVRHQRQCVNSSPLD